MSLEIDASTDSTVIGSRRSRLLGRIIRDVLLMLAVVATVAVAVLVAVVHIQFMRVVSPSMEPAIGVGDVVLLRDQPAAQVQVGQVVVLPVPDEGGVMYVHRLISVRDVEGKKVVTTKGDANPAPDPWELQIDSASVPLVVGQIPLPGALVSVGGVGMTQFLVALLLALLAAPMAMTIMRRTRVGSRLRGLPVRLSDRRRR